MTALHEGTTGSQSLDLLGRKGVRNNGAAMQTLMTEIKESIENAKTYDDLKP